MSTIERRTSVRKLCALPLKFRAHENQNERIEDLQETALTNTAGARAEYPGKALNVSERGVYFTCREKVNVGQTIVLYLTLPTELTGRAPENLRCIARVVHLDEDGPAGVRGVGACVDQFEPTAAFRNWAN
jgi:hypothetical protein